MRYTLGNKVSDGLYVVLDNGKPTNAVATKYAIFSDESEILGGTYYNGTYLDGIYYNGTYHNGTYHDGIYHDGIYHDGIYLGGTHYGGIYHGGIYHDGTYYDGTYYDGTYRKGYLKLFIQGSKHVVNSPDGKNIAIGCEEHSVKHWLENYKRIGLENGYTCKEVKEYKEYIDIFASHIQEKKNEIYSRK